MSGYRPPGTLGVLRLLALSSLRRLLRAASINKLKRGQAQGAGRKRRRATARKRGDPLTWLLVLMMPVFLFQAAMMSSRAVRKLEVAAVQYAPGEQLVVDSDLYWDLQKNHRASDDEVRAILDRYGVDEDSRPPRLLILERFRDGGADAFVREGSFDSPVPWTEPFEWPNAESRDLFVRGGAVLLGVLTLMLVFLGLGGANATLASGGWAQAWLMTFPVPTRALVVARAFEYALVQFFPWLTLAPLTWTMLRALDQPYALALALLATLATTFLTGAVRLWAETALRLRYSLAALKNVQGLCTIFGLASMALVFAVGLGPSVPRVFVDACVALPEVVRFLPGAWPLAGTAGLVVGPLVSVAAFVGAIALTTRLLRRGVMQSGGVDAGKRGRASDWRRRARRLSVVGKDLLLLRRDRNFMVQTLLVPLFIVGLQLLINPRLASAGADEGGGLGGGATALAYFVGGYGALNGCFQVLSGEGRALWMLFTLPEPIGAVLTKKTRMWAGVAVMFSLVALLLFTLRAGVVSPGAIAMDVVSVAFGAFCAAHLAAGIGVIGADPKANEIPKQPKARHAYLYLFLMASYVPPLLTRDPAARIAGMLVFGTVSYALWQRALDRTRWLLDPLDEDRTAITLFDAGVTIVVWQLLQSATLVIVDKSTRLTPANITWVFLCTGCATLVVAAAVLGLRGVPVRRRLGLRGHGDPPVTWLRAWLFGASAGLLLGLVGLGYVWLVERTGWFVLPEVARRERLELLLLATVAAPCIEELLFRGLLLSGLRRTIGSRLAIVWSALLFAVLHPQHAWAPVFLLGLVCGALVVRGRSLVAAVLAHAVYNLVVVGWR